MAIKYNSPPRSVCLPDGCRRRQHVPSTRTDVVGGCHNRPGQHPPEHNYNILLNDDIVNLERCFTHNNLRVVPTFVLGRASGHDVFILEELTTPIRMRRESTLGQYERC